MVDVGPRLLAGRDTAVRSRRISHRRFLLSWPRIESGVATDSIGEMCTEEDWWQDTSTRLAPPRQLLCEGTVRRAAYTVPTGVYQPTPPLTPQRGARAGRGPLSYPSPPHLVYGATA